MASSSAALASIVPNGPVSLPLMKMSFCTTQNLHPNTKMLWKHLPDRDGMFAVFDTIRQRNVANGVTEARVLKLVRGSDQLEIINLDTLRYQTSLDEEMSESLYLPDGDLRVIVIVKKPLLALRYQLPDGQVRRVQLNFFPESGFDYAVNTLRSVGLPVRDRATMARPQSAQTTLLGTNPRVLQESARDYRGSQNSMPSSTQPLLVPPAPPTPPPCSTSHPSALCLYGSTVNKFDQDHFSKPLLPAVNLSWPGDSVRYTNGLAQQLPASSPDLLRQHDLSTEFKHVPVRLAGSPGLDWQSNSYGLESIRPTTAPVTKSERQAPETAPLSLMLPPDRVLPFSEQKDGLRNVTKQGSKSSQPRPGSRAGLLTKEILRVTPTKSSSARTATNDSETTTATSSFLTSSRATTPCHQRPSTSSSNTEPCGPAPADINPAGAPTNVSVQDRVVQSRAKLAKNTWALDEARFLKYFNEEVFGSIGFLDELIRFAKLQRSFESAYHMLVNAQKARQDRLGKLNNNRHSFREWTTNDVRLATITHRESELRAVVAVITNRETTPPKKRLRSSSQIRESAGQETQLAVSNTVQDTVVAPSLSAPSFSPITPLASRKRPGSVLEETSGNVQNSKSPVMEPMSKPVDEEQGAALSMNEQIDPAATQPNLEIVTQPQSIATAVAAAPVTPNIGREEMTSILEDWAKTSKHLVAVPEPAQTPKQILAAFVAQDQEARIKSLDELIREYIDDENFVKLAEDVEGTWMRMELKP